MNEEPMEEELTAAAALGQSLQVLPLCEDAHRLARETRRTTVSRAREVSKLRNAALVLPGRPKALGASVVSAHDLLRRLQDSNERVSIEDICEEFFRAQLPQKVSTEGEFDAHWELKRVVRRRVLDIVNVLVSLGFVNRSPEGLRAMKLAHNEERDTALQESERAELSQRIEKKREILRALAEQTVALRALQKMQSKKRKKDPTAVDSAVALPFVALAPEKGAVVECELTEPRHDVIFNSNAPFALYDDIGLMHSLELHKCTKAELKNAVPNAEVRKLYKKANVR